MPFGDLEGWNVRGEGRSQGEGIYTHMADRLHCKAESNTAVKQLYPNKK